MGGWCPWTTVLAPQGTQALNKLQGWGPLGKQRPDQTVPGQGHFLRKEGSEHSPVGGSGEAQP